MLVQSYLTHTSSQLFHTDVKQVILVEESGVVLIACQCISEIRYHLYIQKEQEIQTDSQEQAANEKRQQPYAKFPTDVLRAWNSFSHSRTVPFDIAVTPLIMVSALALSEIRSMQLEIFLYKKIKQQKQSFVDVFTQNNHISHVDTHQPYSVL